MPLGVQIIAVADAIDAMTSARPYRAALPVEYALIELRRNKGIQWSSQVVEAVESLLTPPTPRDRVFSTWRFPTWASACPGRTADHRTPNLPLVAGYVKIKGAGR